MLRGGGLIPFLWAYHKKILKNFKNKVYCKLILWYNVKELIEWILGELAQLVERPAVNRIVAGSSPALAVLKNNFKIYLLLSQDGNSW